MPKTIAIDLGGTNLRAAIVKNGKILKIIIKKTPKTKNKLLKELCESINVLNSWSIRRIGVSSAGPLKDGIIKNPPNLPLKNFDLKNFLEKKFKKKVEVENDANCAALAEAKYGCKKKNFILLTLGTGVGGGIIINSKLYKGEGYGGELGHIILNNKKDLEELWKLHRSESKKYFGKTLLIKELLEKNDKNSKKILEYTITYLAQGIASLINIFDPEVIVLAGGVKETGNFFLNKIKKKAYDYVLIPRKTPIIWSKIEHAGIIGASLLF